MAAVLLLAQGLFFGAFLARTSAARRTVAAPRVEVPRAAPRARALVIFHAVGIGFVSQGIAWAFLSRRGRFAPTPGVLAGLAVIVGAAALVVWALRVFASWRLLARLDVGHALCTEGPYRFVRHPLYLAIDLWALGNALAFPGIATLAGAVLTFAGSDLRARAEERLLAEAFGDRYRAYAARVRRVFPGVY